MTLSDLVAILFRASQADTGLLLRTSDPERAKLAFARAREEEHEADIAPLRFRTLQGHPEGNLAIVRVMPRKGDLF